MDMTGAVAAVKRAPCSMMTSANSKSSQVNGNRIGSVSKICVKPRRKLSGGFRDMGHVLYYKKATITAMEMTSCGGLVTEKNVKNDEKKMKKKIKLFKGLSKGLSMLSQAEFAGEDDLEGISKAAETLMQHLDEMKRREKELKKKRKMEKSMLKAIKGAQCQSSSSSSSESSDSECGEVVNLKSLSLKSSSIKPEAPNSCALEVVSVAIPPSIPQQLENESCKLSFSNVAEPLGKRIEVCMGGKCKKSGAAQLVEEFEKIVGEGAVVGCKCMGKCRDGPNVRVLSNEADATGLGNIQSSSLSPPPLCLGVVLEDVGVIVANFLGGGGNGTSCGDHVNLAMATAT